LDDKTTVPTVAKPSQIISRFLLQTCHPPPPLGSSILKARKTSAPPKDFSWEYPVPNNEFLGPLNFVVGRNFLKCFAESEILAMESRLDGSLSNDEKHELLLKLLREKLEAEDKAAAPQTLCDVNHKAWDDIQLGIVTMQGQLSHLSDQEATVRLLISARTDPTNLSHFYNLSSILLQQKKYAEAEETALPVKDWLDGKLGKESPQALGSRTTIAQAVWKQGRVERRGDSWRRWRPLLREEARGRLGFIWMSRGRFWGGLEGS
jgi:hypothetical protein